MPSKQRYDAVIIGAGPNGLAAAITLAQRGLGVLLIEGKETVGGGSRSAALTLPGYVHDVCSAIHPLGLASPFFRALPLEQFGLEWVFPEFETGHPLDGGEAVLVERSIEETAVRLGGDAGAYRGLMAPYVRNWQPLLDNLLGPLTIPWRHLPVYARFALPSLLPARAFAGALFRERAARALFAGMAAHSMLPLTAPGTAGFGLMLEMLTHAVGWPMARGGSQKIAAALAAYLETLGGEIEVGHMVAGMDELPEARAYLFDVTPRQLVKIAGRRLPDGYLGQLRRFRYGVGVFKIDYALSEPVPWKNQELRRAGTVHVGGSLEEITQAERVVWDGQHPESPFIILAQQSQFDGSRAPEGRQTAWAYCHVPGGSTEDMTARMEKQIERFAPGFRDVVLARSTRTAVEMEAYNPNYIGGDINGGVQDLGQFFTRPVARIVPYSTPARDIYICSSSTPPGGGVHGMCGYHAARAAMRSLF